MVMGSSLWTTLFTLATPLRTMATPIMPDGKDAEGAQQDLEPVVAHSFTPGEPGPSIDRAPAGEAPGRLMFQLETPTGKGKFHRDRGRRPAKGVRRPCRGPGPDLPGAARRGGRPGRAQRGRQDHHPALPRRDHRSRPAGGCGSPGHDLATDPVAAKSALAFIPDEPHLFEYLTVEEHLRFVARLYRVADVDARIPGVLRELELEDRAARPPGGALPGHEAEARDRLRPAARPRGAPAGRAADRARPGRHPPDEGYDHCTRREPVPRCILSSHLLHLVEEICTRVLVMRRGRVAGLRHHRRDRGGAARRWRGCKLEDVFLGLVGQEGVEDR